MSSNTVAGNPRAKQSNGFNQHHQNGAGFTIIELLITTFIIGTVVTGLFGLFVLNLRLGQEAERRLVAIALANERAEMIRNLPYAEVGTSGGVPAGTIAQQETVVRNSISYTVRTDIRYIDDPFDGMAGSGGNGCVTICHVPPGNPGSQTTLCVGQSSVNSHIAHGDQTGACGGGGAAGPDEYNADYKQARIEVSWPSPHQPRPLLLVVQVAPAGVEGSETAGTLDFQALSAAGAGVADATLRVINSAVNPAIDLTTNTNSEGRVILPGLPVSSGTYKLTLTKNGHVGDQTYDATASFTPDADHRHLSMIQGQITPKTFAIDLASSLSFQTRKAQGGVLNGIAYALRGSKAIGQNQAGDPVYRVNLTGQTAQGGNANHNNLVWDTYQFTIDGVATGYDIKETSELLPLQLDPGEAADMAVTLVDHTDQSLHVTVANPAGEPIDNATVQLTKTGYDETLGTGVVGQVLFEDLPSAGDYTLSITAPQYQAYTDTATVAGTTRVRANLTISP